MLGLLLALALSGGSCKTDDDCTLRTRCSCECCRYPEAMTKAEAEAERKRCMALGPCGPAEGCPPGRCAPEKPAVAVCRAGGCVKETADAGR